MKIPGSFLEFELGEAYEVFNGSTWIGMLTPTPEGIIWRPYVRSDSDYYPSDSPLKNFRVFRNYEDLEKVMDGNIIIKRGKKRGFGIQLRKRNFDNPLKKMDWFFYNPPFESRKEMDSAFEGLIRVLKFVYKVDRVGYYLACNDGEIEFRVVNMEDMSEVR